MTFSPHERWMRRCLDLAAQGRGLVGNGALVGAVLVRSDAVIAEGYHHGFGMPHAERDLLQKFDQKISSKDVLYVNLEPCCHHGKTPPCSDAIIAAGIRRIVFGMTDPDSRVAGNGAATLREAGIEVIGPVSSALCERFNRGFVSVRRHGRPWVTLKQAIAADGSIAHADGTPRRITSDAQNAWSHLHLRSAHDAIMVGIGTVLTDDPILNNRSDQFFTYEIKQNYEQKNRTNKKSEQTQPLRIILDPQLRCPPNARVVSDGRPERTVLIADEARTPASHPSLLAMRDRGIRVVRVPATAGGSLFGSALWQALLTLEGGRLAPTSMLLEGGAVTWRLAREAGIVDEHILLAEGDCSSGKCSTAAHG